jgi:hypothetical protein
MPANETMVTVIAEQSSDFSGLVIVIDCQTAGKLFTTS